MADKKITELTELTTPALEDLFAIVDNPSGTPVTKKVTAQNLRNYVFPDTRIATKIVAADGSGDYTDIQSAINALPDSGGLVFIKNGTYTLSSKLTIAKSNVSLVGQGPATIITLAGNVNDNVLDIGNGVDNIVDVVVSDLTIDGNRLNQTSGYGIRIQANCDRISILRCIIKSCYDGGIGRLAEATYTRVEGCTFFDCQSYVLLLMYGSYSLVRDNYFHDCNINSGYLIELYQETDFLVEGNILIGGSSGNIPYGIVVYDSDYGTVSGNYIRKTVRGIRQTSGSDGNVVVGNVVIETRGTGIESGDTDNVISGNLILSPGSYGITFDGSNHLIQGNTVKSAGDKAIYGWSGKHVIQGNNIYDSKKDGIFLYTCTHCLVEGNRIYNSGQSADNTYTDIFLGTGSSPYASYNFICNNYILADGTNKTKYGIRENSANDNYNMIWNNRIIGPVTAAISIQGANSNASENILG